MSKKNPLAQALNAPLPSPSIAVEATSAPTPRPAKRVAPSRTNRVLIGGHFAADVQIALKVLAARERTTVQALLEEGINAVFARRQHPQIAALSPEAESIAQ